MKNVREFGSRSLTIKVFSPDGELGGNKTQWAPPGKVFSPVLIERLLDETMMNLCEAMPEYEYKRVKVAFNHYNFVCQGPRAEQTSECGYIEAGVGQSS